MGMSADFYVGDTTAIAKAYSEGKLAVLQGAPVVRWHADFGLSLHLHDLDLLSKTACAFADKPPLTLTDSVYADLAGDGQSFGVHSISEHWAAAVASLRESQVADVAAAWFVAFAEHAHESVREPTPQALRATGDLLFVCRIARDEHLPVVFAWRV